MSKEKNEKDTGPTKVNTEPTEQPVDYSFFKITALVELSTTSSEVSSDSDLLKPRLLHKSIKSSPKKTDSGKSASKCLNISNNNLSDLAGIMEVVAKSFDEPTNLMWLDISNNELNAIDEVLLEFPNIQILNLHGNSISDIDQVDKLAALTNLKKLTLHGNPIEGEKAYRYKVISKLSSQESSALKSLDSSNITKADRATAASLRFSKKIKKKKNKDD